MKASNFFVSQSDTHAHRMVALLRGGCSTHLAFARCRPLAVAAVGPAAHRWASPTLAPGARKGRCASLTHTDTLTPRHTTPRHATLHYNAPRTHARMHTATAARQSTYALTPPWTAHRSASPNTSAHGRQAGVSGCESASRGGAVYGARSYCCAGSRCYGTRCGSSYGARCGG